MLYIMVLNTFRSFVIFFIFVRKKSFLILSPETIGYLQLGSAVLKQKKKKKKRKRLLFQSPVNTNYFFSCSVLLQVCSRWSLVAFLQSYFWHTLIEICMVFLQDLCSMFWLPETKVAAILFCGYLMVFAPDPELLGCFLFAQHASCPKWSDFPDIADAYYCCLHLHSVFMAYVFYKGFFF